MVTRLEYLPVDKSRNPNSPAAINKDEVRPGFPFLVWRAQLDDNGAVITWNIVEKGVFQGYPELTDPTYDPEADGQSWGNVDAEVTADGKTTARQVSMYDLGIVPAPDGQWSNDFTTYNDTYGEF